MKSYVLLCSTRIAHLAWFLVSGRLKASAYTACGGLPYASVTSSLPPLIHRPGSVLAWLEFRDQRPCRMRRSTRVSCNQVPKQVPKFLESLEMLVVASCLTGNEVSASIRPEVTPDAGESGCAIPSYSNYRCGCAGSFTKQRRPNARHVSRSSNALRLRMFSSQRSFPRLSCLYWNRSSGYDLLPHAESRVFRLSHVLSWRRTRRNEFF